ncbi:MULTISPECIES: hypothetical protein [Sorangium]|uniref:Uncharacterized protein n=1 Tax=Sorangium cellulosum TaxID=56 RepID=A0A4P2R389_SORCE|nr:MULTISPECIES: hypothetical protein [Sorangium]AUX37514.1 uncharacterized protein SOCE836_097390 [Sorangium cellulosum]WCQ96803.1 hypothetical protein NQZ70_09590 [Sorangium sp. Soce836]
MAHPVGEKLRCDDCGAEIVYLAACNCPSQEQSQHANVCCGKEMRSLGIVAETQAAAASAPKKSAA